MNKNSAHKTNYDLLLTKIVSKQKKNRMPGVLSSLQMVATDLFITFLTSVFSYSIWLSRKRMKFIYFTRFSFYKQQVPNGLTLKMV